LCNKLDLTVSRLKQAMAHAPPQRLQGQGSTATAVLLPLYQDKGAHHLIFIQRSETVSHHSGQISFPGGHREKEDADVCATAIRECVEEIGVQGNISVLGQLDDVETLTSGYIISPFVGLIEWPQELVPDRREVASIFSVPVSHLLNCPCLGDETIVKDHPLTLFSYTYGNKVIWGATARILRQFLDLYARTV
jgi:8-oxo-dGTP pyrophosphatase MutT (NUDIX family)